MANSAVPVAFGTAPPPHPPAIIELSATPLTIMRWSDVRPPLASSEATSWTTEPPTSCPVNAPLRTPGISTPTVKGVRELGIALTISWSMTAWRVVDCRSTVGVTPETVIVSCTPPTSQVGVDREDAPFR